MELHRRMRLTRRLLAGVAAALLCIGDLYAAPVDLSDRMDVVTANPKTTLDRATGRTISTVDVTLTNKGTRPVETPLHALVFFTAQSGSLTGLQVTGANGGLGVAPYQTFFYDLTGAVPQSLAPRASVSFVLRFSPARNTQVSYRIVPFGVLNQDPVANAGGPYAAQVGQAISFSSAASTDPDGDPITVSWNFGDGTPPSSDRNPTHAFSATGVFEVTLTVRDSRGGVSTARVPAVISPAEEFGLARVRTLDGAGLPLTGVEVNEKVAGQANTFSTDATTGYSSLGRGPGTHTWKFSKPGHLDVWRRATLAANTVTILPNPWLTKQSSASTAISPISDARLSANGVTIDFPAGTFDQPTTASVTALHAQALPFPLPVGWSPLSQFHLQLGAAPTAPGGAVLTLAEPLASGEEAAFVKFNPTALQWEVVALVSGTTTVAAPITSDGSFAVVVRDSGPRAPPAPAVGQPIEATTAASDISGITAAGSVTPAVSSPSRDAAQVTANARVVFNNPTALSSGLFFRTIVKESYTLFGGSTRRAPDYDTTVFAYHRPGDALAANFPMRPQLLLGPDELMEATVRAEVLAPGVFAGGVIGATGGQLADDGTRAIIPPGALNALQAIELGALDPQSFTGLTGGSVPARAFTLNIGTVAEGQKLAFDFDAVEPDAFYVLGRAVSLESVSGLAPLERFVSDAEGRLTSAEPASGPRLPGVRGSGEYVLLKVAGPLALVHGTVADTSGSPSGGLIVQVAGQPWVFVSGADGSYLTLAPVGTTQLIVSDVRDGNQGFSSINVTDPAQTHEANVSTAPTGPRVASTDPAAGATGVRTVTPVVVRFSERIVPASFGASGVVLRAADGSVVPGSVSLNSTATIATLLPTNPLAPDAPYTIEVSAAIRDLTDLPLEGTRTFTFTTAPVPARGDGGQLVIYEPGATNIPQNAVDMIPAFTPQAGSSIVVAHGSQGTADPEVPVVLVNQTTGQTATVLSKPDGSFASFVNAAEEDFISAVFINANGTRIEVPATRQLFDDGRVGLYRQGGILEAESDGGEVQVQIAPNAVRSKNVFNVARLNFAEIQALLNGTVPKDGAAVIGGAKFEMQGDPLAESAEISIPATAESLGLPPGSDPAAATFALTTVREVLGVKVFEVLDKMEFREGKLTTASPPFIGALVGGPLMFLKLANGGKAVVTGRAVTSFGAGSGEQPVPGAIVTYHTIGSGGGRPIGGGEIISVADEKGGFRLLVPLAFFEALGDSLLLNGLSALQPGRIGTGKVRLIPSPNLAAATGNVVFPSPGAQPAIPDTRPPMVFARLARTGFAPQPGEAFEIVVQAIDDVSAPDVTASSPAFLAELSNIAGPFDRRSRFSVLAPAGSVPVTVTAVDAVGNSRVATFNFDVGAGPPPPPLLVDPSDTDPPFVLRSEPIEGDQVADFRQPVKLVFNEAINSLSASDLANGAVLTPSAGSPFVRISPDNRTLELSYPTLKGGTNYTLTLSPNHYRDFAGNQIDQDRINATADGQTTPFVLSFRTRGEEEPNALAIGNGGGVAASADGTVLYALERGQQGLLRSYVATADGSYSFEEAHNLPETPRDLVVIDRFDLVIPDPQNLTARQQKRIPNAQIVLVVGGDVGGFSSEGFEGIGPWVAAYYRVAGAGLKRLFVQRLTELGPSLLLKIAYDRGRLAILESGPEATGVNLLDLQLYLWSQHPLAAQVPELNLDDPGADLNGDGDYGDPGEQIPLPPDGPRIGFVNSGLITTLTVPPGERISDFALALGGRFVSAVTTQPATARSRLRILWRQDAPVAPGSPSSEALLPEEGKRVFNLFGAEIETPTGTRFANLILVSAGERLLVYELDPSDGALTLVAEVNFPNGAGRVQSVQPVTPVFGWPVNGLLAVATTEDVYFLDPRRLLSTAQNGVHPALSGVVRGFGVGARSFVALSNGTVAVALGGRSRINQSVRDVVFTVGSVFAEDVNQSEPGEEPLITIGTPQPAPPTPPVVRQSRREPVNPSQPVGPANPAVPLLEVVAKKPASPSLLNPLGFDNALLGNPTSGSQAAPDQSVATATVYAHANIIPQDITPGSDFPKWKKDGLAAGSGKSITVQRSLSTNDAVDYFLNLRPYTEVSLEAEGSPPSPLTLRVYPPVEVEKEIELGAVTEKLEDAFEKLSDAFKAASTGLVTGEFKVEFPEKAELTLAASFKESPTDHKVYFAPRGAVKLSPMIGLSGKVKLGPKLPGVGEANLFVEAYGRVNLEGSIERVVNETVSGVWQGCLTLPATVGVAVGAKIEAGLSFGEPILSAEIKLDAPINVTGQVCVQPRWIIEGSVGATFPGLTGSLEAKFQFMGYDLEKEYEVQILGPTPLIDPPIKTTLATFSFE